MATATSITAGSGAGISPAWEYMVGALMSSVCCAFSYLVSSVSKYCGNTRDYH